MFSKLSSLLSSKFHKNDDLSRQIEIVKVFDLYRSQLKKTLPEAEVKLVSLKNKTLLVELNNSVLASELRLRESDIISKVNSTVEKEVLRKVIYRF